MKAIRYSAYGSPDVLQLREVEIPVVGDDDVLVRVMAASVNPLDWHFMRGLPYLVRLQGGMSRPKVDGLGTDLAGRVEAVGRNVTEFKPGDEVFGGASRTFAEYAVVRKDGALSRKPVNVTFEQAGTVAVAGITALQALRDIAKVKPGQKVLVNGAAGGVGSFAVQIAKAYGTEVTGVCSSGNVEMVRSIGADKVVDYTREDFVRGGVRYDAVIDVVGNRSLADCRRVLAPGAVMVGIGSPSTGKWLGPMNRPVRMLAVSPFARAKLRPFLSSLRKDDIGALAELLEVGKVTPVIDRTYSLTEVPAAVGYVEEGHAKGKVVIAIP